MAENNPPASPAADDPSHAERGKYSASTSAPSALTPAGQPASISRKSLLTAADYERALDALDLIFQDDEPPIEESRIRQPKLVARLQAKGITRALAEALIDWLVEANVFKAGQSIIDIHELHCLDGTSVDYGSEISRELHITRDRWYGYLAKERDRRAAPGLSPIETRPDSPRPPDGLVEAAMRDLPGTMADMDNTREFYAPTPTAGHKIVLYRRLIQRLEEKHGHGKTASEWAIHRLLELGRLTAQYGRCDWPSVQTRDGVWHGGESYEVRELNSYLITSTPLLWEWWHSLENEMNEPSKGERTVVDGSRHPAPSAKNAIESADEPAAPARSTAMAAGVNTPIPSPAQAHDLEDVEAELAAAGRRRAEDNAAQDAFRQELALSAKMDACFRAARQVKIEEARQELGREKVESITDKECYTVWGKRIKAFVSVLEERNLFDVFLGLPVPEDADPDYKLGAKIGIKAVRLARSEPAEALADFLVQILHRTPELLTPTFAMGSGWFYRAYIQADNEARRRWPAANAPGAQSSAPDTGAVTESEGMTTKCARTLLSTQEGTLPSALPASQITSPAAQTSPALVPAPMLEIDLEVQGIALLFKHEHWSLAEIAEQLKVDRKTLYKWKKFRQAAELCGRLKPRGPKDAAPPRGHKTRDGQVEAYADMDVDD